MGLVRNKVVSTCKAILCRNTIYLRSPNAAALQGNIISIDFLFFCFIDFFSSGTECGKGRHCRGGMCVGRGETVDTDTTTTMMTTTSEKTTIRSSHQPSQVFFPSRAMGICQFFRQFGIQLDYCP